MEAFRPPVDDICFALEHLAGYHELAALPVFSHADFDSVREIAREAGDLIARVIAPTNRPGDLEGARLEDGAVRTPTGFREAYAALVQGGWPSLSFPEEFGGGAFPQSVGLAIFELLTSANTALSLNPMLTQGAIEAILHHGTDEQKATYLPKLISGQWSASMNLTEPQAGSDLGALRTSAARRPDGTYSINGAKIFITYGDHDLTEQIVHLVLARLPDAPEGTAGISCFLVPKFLVDDGQLGERNGAQVTGIEHKLGIHGSPTCSMQFEDATGYLLGEENKGLAIMFVMMNHARLGVGIQGIGLAERAYQQSLAYARERVQGAIDGEPVVIAEHPDVRRMLLTQRAWIAGLRGLAITAAAELDRAAELPDADARTLANERVEILTPIVKSLGTDVAVETTSLALQIHGGMGYIEEAGAAQHFRDVRITPIYEGTNGIQAADLVGRKFRIRDGDGVRDLIAYARSVDAELASAREQFAGIRAALAAHFDRIETATEHLLAADTQARLAASTPYLRMLGTGLCGWQLARAALAARTAEPGDDTRLELAQYFCRRLLPPASGLLDSVLAGDDGLYAIPLGRLG